MARRVVEAGLLVTQHPRHRIRSQGLDDVATEYGATLKGLMADQILTSAHGIYTGPTELKDGPLHVWPLMRFFKELSNGNILG